MPFTLLMAAMRWAAIRARGLLTKEMQKLLAGMSARWWWRYPPAELDRRAAFWIPLWMRWRSGRFGKETNLSGTYKVNIVGAFVPSASMLVRIEELKHVADRRWLTASCAGQRAFARRRKVELQTADIISTLASRSRGAVEANYLKHGDGYKLPVTCHHWTYISMISVL